MQPVIKTAKALGLTVPSTLLARTDEVIDGSGEETSLLGSTAAWPLMARAQHRSKLPML